MGLTLAGSDNCAGAGIQADLKTFHAHGVYGLTAITAVVAEIPGQVKSISPLPYEAVQDQLELLFQSFPIGAWKTGMLPSAQIVKMAARVQAEQNAIRPIPLVLDPVLVASSGDALAGGDVVDAFCESLFPLATLITPNLNEAERLSGERIRNLENLESTGKILATRFGVPFLMKGGHLRGDLAVDLLIDETGRLLETLSAPFEKSVDPHGTGCTYSAAITANLAAGLDLLTACQNAKFYITQAILQRHRWHSPSGQPLEALCHFQSNKPR